MYAGYGGDMIMTSFSCSLMFLALTMFLFSYVFLNSPRVLWAPACHSNGMQMTSFSQGQSFPAFGSPLSGMDARASEEVISGKTDESAESGLSLSQESHTLLDDLLLLEGMERENKAGEEAVGMAAAELSSHTVQEMLDSVRDLKGEELTRALRGIELLGRYEAMNTKWDLSLSGLGVAFLLRYTFEMLPSNVTRCVEAAYKSMLPPGDRNGEALIHLIGIGNHRLQDGLQELQETGLSFNIERPNKKGAGRPSSTDTFREKMTPCVMAAGISASDLDALKEEIADSKALELPIGPVTPEEDSSSGTEDGTEDGAGSAAVQEQKDDAGVGALVPMEDYPGPEEMQTALDNLRRQVSAIEEAVKPFIVCPKYRSGLGVQEFFAFCWQVLDSIGSGLEHQISFGQGKEGNDDPDFMDILHDLNIEYLSSIKTKLGKLQNVFKTLGEAPQRTGSGPGHRISCDLDSP